MRIVNEKLDWNYTVCSVKSDSSRVFSRDTHTHSEKELHKCRLSQSISCNMHFEYTEYNLLYLRLLFKLTCVLILVQRLLLVTSRMQICRMQWNDMNPTTNKILAKGTIQRHLQLIWKIKHRTCACTKGTAVNFESELLVLSISARPSFSQSIRTGIQTEKLTSGMIFAMWTCWLDVFNRGVSRIEYMYLNIIQVEATHITRHDLHPARLLVVASVQEVEGHCFFVEIKLFDGLPAELQRRLLQYVTCSHSNNLIEKLTSLTSSSPSVVQALSLKHLGLTTAMTWPCFRESQGQWGNAISLYPSTVLTSCRYCNQFKNIKKHWWRLDDTKRTSFMFSSSLNAFNFDPRFDGFSRPREMS